MSKLYYIYGTMGSAKSANLLTKAYSLLERGFKVILMKPGIDTRDKSIIKSRIGISMKCDTFDKDYDFKDFEQRYDILQTDKVWVLIDEIQFITEEQGFMIADIVDRNSNINIICYGLRTDYLGELFPGAKSILGVADTIEEIKSTCSCGRKTIYNAKLNNGINTSKESIDVGGDDKYVALCRVCYKKQKEQNKII